MYCDSVDMLSDSLVQLQELGIWIWELKVSDHNGHWVQRLWEIVLMVMRDGYYARQ